MTVQFLGVVEKDEGSAYGIWFPDVPGCFPAADDLEDLPATAAELLRQHVEALESAGNAVPKPRPFDAALNDKDVRQAMRRGATTLLVPLLADEGRTVRVNVSFDRGLVGQIDEAAKARGLTRSAFMAQAAREKISGAR